MISSHTGAPRPVEVDAVRVAVGFATTLRAAGVPASPERVHAFTEALSGLDPAREEHVYWAGRITLCGRREDHEAYDRAFAAYFGGERPPQAPMSHTTTRVLVPVQAAEPGEDDGSRDRSRPPLAQASRTEVLKAKDVSELTDAERQDLQRLLALLDMTGELRRSRRWQRSRKGAVDRAATVRHLLRTGGEPVHLHRRTHRRRPRRVVIIADVSGSMSAYSDAMLRFAHAAARRSIARTEVFTLGTRLTRVTRELTRREPDSAMAEVAEAVPDWSGGTRLGERLKSFLDEWGQRGMARGAVVVILSDGWEQGDVALLSEQMARLHRHAHRVVWANPRKARPGYEPLVGGMAAALPYVDDFVEGHSIEALERLARIVAGVVEAPRPRSRPGQASRSEHA